MTYNTAQDLVDYAAARGATIALADAPVLLQKAQDWLTAQSLTIPDPVPDALVQAEAAAALVYHEGGDPLAALSPRVTQETVGPVSVSYSDRGPLVTLYPLLLSLIAPYRSGGFGGSNFALTRA